MFCMRVLSICIQHLFASAAMSWCACTFALSPDLPITELHHTAWGPSQGAPLGGAVGLAQTEDGYLWVAGPSGLFRFDGITFERVELPHDPKLSSYSLQSLFAPRGGGLWVGFTFGGVAHLKGGRWQVFSAVDGIPSGSPMQFAETPDGAIWVAARKGLARFDGARWKVVGYQMGLPASHNITLFVDSQGTVWAGGGDRLSLFFLRPGENQFRNQPITASTSWIGMSMVESSVGTVWLDLGHELVPVAQNPPPGKPSRSSGAQAAFDDDGTLWMSWGGVRRIAHLGYSTIGVALDFGDPANIYTDSNGLTSRTVLAVLADREGNIWVGTTYGLDRFSEPRLIAPLQSAENLKVFPEISEMGIAPADDVGGLWVSNGDDAVARYQDGRLRTPMIRQEVESLMRASDGTVWFGGHKALWHERQGHLESVVPPRPDLETQALAEDKSGRIWASVLGSGVFRLQDGVWTQYGGITELPRGTPITMARDRRGRLWFSYPGGNVAVLDGERVRIYGVTDGLEIGIVTAIHSGLIGHWFGGEFGLARLEGERFNRIQSALELPLEGITGIVETPNGDLWLNGRSGIAHIAASELEQSRLDPAYRVRGEAFGAFDGIVGSGQMLRPLPTAIEAADGKLWFATTGGIYGIDPARRVHNRVPPPVLIRALTVAGHTIEPVPGLSLPAYTTAVHFDYMGLSLTAAEKVRYRYRLEGVDTDWRELTAARQALYTNMRPGKYTFHVIAANNDGVWNKQGASLGFRIPPAFVQTVWFLALCVAAGALAVWALVRLRVRQVAARVRGRMEAQLAERERIARELHDTLMQSTQGLILTFQGFAGRLAKIDPMRPEMEGALDQADELLNEARERVLQLRTTPPDGDLAVALDGVGQEIFLGSTTRLSLKSEGGSKPLQASTADEVCLIIREALKNVRRHAGARGVELTITYERSELRIRVRDDGRGISADDMDQTLRPTHFGIKGMHERALRIDSRLDIRNVPTGGTEVDLRVPANTAFVHSLLR
jgi:signal transduction histidine kinase/ligand-binding sensor domain-containing protein